MADATNPNTMNFVVYSFPVAINYADSLVARIRQAGHNATLAEHNPSVTDILNAQNANQRVLILGYEDANSDHVTERVGGTVVQRTRSDFLNTL
jgi:hypothetical protein